MNSDEYIIGEMICFDDIRKVYIPFLNPDNFDNEEIKKILTSLKEGEFSFENYYKKNGKESLIYSIELSERFLNEKKLMQGKI